jgi:hypothetical protein
MVTEKLAGEDLLAMQNEKGNICVSVIVPTHRLSPERRTDKLEVERAVDKATQLLYYKYPEQEIKPLLRSLDELTSEIDFNHPAEGIGLFVSHNIHLSVQFPFPVEEKVMVEDNFEMRDLLYKEFFIKPYFVLMLTEKGARLFEGLWKDLEEIRDKNFPKDYEDEFIYNSPSQGSSAGGYAHVKSFEKDKSILEEIRFKAFFKEIDKVIEDYLVDNISLVVLGPEKLLALFKKVSVHKKRIIGIKEGSYGHQNLKQLTDITWPLMINYREQEQKNLVNEFEEKIGERLGISGIEDIWSAAKEGKAFKLLVEKDYRCPGFLTENEYHLYLRPPERSHRVLADAVDELIETVLEKNGQVIFMDNGKLKDYSRIALITRY